MLASSVDLVSMDSNFFCCKIMFLKGFLNSDLDSQSDISSATSEIIADARRQVQLS